MPILPVIGMIFLLFGTVVLLAHFYYITHGKECKGKIIAYEKYSSATGTHGHKRHQLYYRPIYEYLYNGEKIWFIGGGSGTIDKKIGDEITILSLNKGPAFCYPKTNTSYAFGLFFFVGGLIPLGIDWYYTESLFAKWAPILITVVAIFQLYFYLRVKGLLDNVLDGILKQASLETLETLKLRKIFWTNEELTQEVAFNYKAAVFISFIFFTLSCWGSSFFWMKLPEATQDSMMEGTIEKTMLAPLILGTFSFISLVSLLSSLRKWRGSVS